MGQRGGGPRSARRLFCFRPAHPPPPSPELAPETATAYRLYGEALLLHAQADSDVLGARVRAAADERATAQAAADAAAAAGEEAPGVEAGGKENTDRKGKGRAVEEGGEGEEEGEGDDAESSSDADDENGDPATADDDDTDLAWQMLDAARSILERCGPARASELADTHVLLGDVATEQERFDDADGEYGAALGILDALGAASGRRGGEAHFKRCVARQLAGGAAAALESAVAAVACVQAAVQRDPRDATLPLILADLTAKAAELEAPAREVDDLKAVMASALGAAGGGGGGGGGFDAPSVGGGAQVADLGVVGRAAKRGRVAPALLPSTAPVAVPAGFGGGGAAPAGGGRLEALVGARVPPGCGGAPAAPATGDAAAAVTAAPSADAKAAAPTGPPAFLAAYKGEGQ